MSPEDLIFSAMAKVKMESVPIIDDAIAPVFNEIASILNDSDPDTAAQVLEDLQDMVFDQPLRKLAKISF